MIDRIASPNVGPAASHAPNGAQRGGAAGADPAADFASMLSNLMTDTIETVRSGEVAASEGLSGRMPLQEVVNRVMTAEQSLQAALAVRDKVVTAYLEISRMTI